MIRENALKVSEHISCFNFPACILIEHALASKMKFPIHASRSSSHFEFHFSTNKLMAAANVEIFEKDVFVSGAR
jgi:hypothetical protein